MQLFLLIVALLMAPAFSFLAAPKFSTRIMTNTDLNAVKLTANDDEPIENAIKRFKRAINQSGHLMDLRFREQWETAAELKKRKKVRSRLMDKIERTNDKYEKKAQGYTEYNS